MNKNNLCYCILTKQYVKRHCVAGYLLVIIFLNTHRLGHTDTQAYYNIDCMICRINKNMMSCFELKSVNTGVPPSHEDVQFTTRDKDQVRWSVLVMGNYHHHHHHHHNLFVTFGCAVVCCLSIDSCVFSIFPYRIPWQLCLMDIHCKLQCTLCVCVNSILCLW